MIRYLTHEALGAEPEIARGMFRDRKAQFADRHAWPVSVDAEGCERDQYDRPGAVYVIWAPGGVHAASMRCMSTLGPHMTAEHFANLTFGARRAPDLWESTRFALAPGAPRGAAAAVLLGAQVLGLRLGLAGAVGVYDVPMERVYRRLGWAPDPLGRTGPARTDIAAGIWRFSPSLAADLARRADVPLEAAEAAYGDAFGRAALAA